MSQSHLLSLLSMETSTVEKGGVMLAVRGSWGSTLVVWARARAHPFCTAQPQSGLVLGFVSGFPQTYLVLICQWVILFFLSIWELSKVKEDIKIFKNKHSVVWKHIIRKWNVLVPGWCPALGAVFYAWGFLIFLKSTAEKSSKMTIYTHDQ